VTHSFPSCRPSTESLIQHLISRQDTIHVFRWGDRASMHSRGRGSVASTLALTYWHQRCHSCRPVLRCSQVKHTAELSRAPGQRQPPLRGKRRCHCCKTGPHYPPSPHAHPSEEDEGRHWRQQSVLLKYNASLCTLLATHCALWQTHLSAENTTIVVSHIPFVLSAVVKFPIASSGKWSNGPAAPLENGVRMVVRMVCERCARMPEWCCRARTGKVYHRVICVFQGQCSAQDQKSGSTYQLRHT
jgi:hypothetical protein